MRVQQDDNGFDLGRHTLLDLAVQAQMAFRTHYKHHYSQMTTLMIYDVVLSLKPALKGFKSDVNSLPKTR